MATTYYGNKRQMRNDTLLRIYEAWEEAHLDEGGAHILRLAGYSGCWPGTIYNAYYLGYLDRLRPAIFIPTERMMYQIRTMKHAQ